MNLRLDPPAGLHGTDAEKLTQLYSYLFRLSESLNIALDAAGKPENSEKTGGTGQNRAQLTAEETLRAALQAQEKTLLEAVENAAETAEKALAAHKNEPVYPVSVG